MKPREYHINVKIEMQILQNRQRLQHPKIKILSNTLIRYIESRADSATSFTKILHCTLIPTKVLQTTLHTWYIDTTPHCAITTNIHGTLIQDGIAQ